MIGIIGLGRMGESLALRLLIAGFQVIGFDRSQTEHPSLNHYTTYQQATSLQEMASKADVVWLMVPAGPVTGNVIMELSSIMNPGSIIIDGGNSHFKDSIQRAQMLAAKTIEFIDCGTSGGVHGRDVGFSLMIGAKKETFARCEQYFKAIAAPGGYAHVGPIGAGHYVKMIHNGIEYALLQSYAEGFDLLKHGAYPGLDLEQISNVWRHGSIIRSWILDLAHTIFSHDQDFTDITGVVQENGTGRWTVDEAHERHVSVQLIEDALNIRALSRQTGGNYGTKLVALLRNEFGKHALIKPEPEEREL